MPQIDPIRKLEMELARRYDRRHCRVVSRGAVAIYLAIATMEEKPKKVVLPSTICMSPVNAVIYAGHRPVFADVDLADFNIDVANLRLLLETDADIAAIVLPHMYGQPADIDEVAALARSHGVLLVEDAAQAMGGFYKDRPLGSFGDFSILSFGHTKIIDTGGCGALLFDDDKYVAKVDRAIEALPAQAAGFADLQEKYSRAYYGLRDLIASDRSLNRLYMGFPYIFKELYLYREVEVEAAVRAQEMLKGLEQAVATRNRAAAYYRANLVHEDIVHPEYKRPGVCWRYGFIIKHDNQTKIAERIRAKGVPVSNWYPPAHLFYEAEPRELPNAEYLGAHIFNLWVEPDYTEDDRAKAVAAVLEAIAD